MPPANAERISGEKPDNVTEPERVFLGRVRIQLRVGVNVMLAMMTRPPQRSALPGCAAQQRHDKSKHTTALERPMRKKTMVERSDQKHSGQVQTDSQYDGKPTDPDPNNAKTSQVNHQNGNNPPGDPALWASAKVFCRDSDRRSATRK